MDGRRQRVTILHRVSRTQRIRARSALSSILNAYPINDAGFARAPTVIAQERHNARARVIVNVITRRAGAINRDFPSPYR